MAQISIKCGGCGIGTTVRSATDEDARKAVSDWESGHEEALHDGEEQAWQEDNPFFPSR